MDANWYKAVKITGPTHNFLAVQFSNERVKEVNIQALQSQFDQNLLQLRAEDVQKQVLDGIAEGNRICKTDYNLRSIQFIPTDTPSSSIYRQLAEEIVKRLATGKEFVKQI